MSMRFDCYINKLIKNAGETVHMNPYSIIQFIHEIDPDGSYHMQISGYSVLLSYKDSSHEYLLSTWLIRDTQPTNIMLLRYVNCMV